MENVVNIFIGGFKTMYNTLVKEIEMSDKSNQEKIIGLVTILEEIGQDKRLRHQSKFMPKEEPSLNFFRVEAISREVKTTDEKL